MLKMVEWLENNFQSIQPDRDITLRAARHLSKPERRKLFSADVEPMRTAEGRWYEAIVYEMVLKLALQSDLIKGVVRKGADARHIRQKVELGQNGLFYSRLGDINIRGNGQDLAEFDLMLIDRNDRIAFGEIVTSPLDMKEFGDEIRYKKRLLGYLFGQETVPFILISSVDISRIVAVRRLMKEADNILIHTQSCGEIKTCFRPFEIRNIPRKPAHHPKLVSVHEIGPLRQFDYKRLHDIERERVLRTIAKSGSPQLPENADPAGLLVKKILFGALYPSAIRMLDQEYEILIRGRDCNLDCLSNEFSKVVLAADLPGFDPIIYLRSKKDKEYLKMVKSKGGTFKFERYTPNKVGFFLWLESLRPNLGARITKDLLDAFVGFQEAQSGDARGAKEAAAIPAAAPQRAKRKRR
ncbi:MAG: hypothetical protein QMD46_10780 [Methanomicrobiales archaeon]|nr:hypothetical protein [Methanomicrobiales archaeon]MDI6876613.1 hypothetical protein [Methanomicrobiales archaeon]